MRRPGRNAAVLPEYLYRLYGVTVFSEFLLPDLRKEIDFNIEATPGNAIEIVAGTVPERLQNARDFGWIDASIDQCIFHFKGRCRIQVSYGKRITVERLGEISDQEIATYIAGCGFPVIAYMRGMLPLHVSVVKTAYGDWMFAGESGAGKSTTAAMLAREPGNRLLCDDIAVLDPGRDGKLYFGINKIKLWEDALDKLGIRSSEAEPDLVRTGKYHVRADADEYSRIQDLSAVVVLKWGAQAHWQALSKPRLFAAVLNALHAPFLATVYYDLNELQRVAIRLAEQVDGHAWTRARGAYSPIELVNQVKDSIAK